MSNKTHRYIEMIKIIEINIKRACERTFVVVPSNA